MMNRVLLLFTVFLCVLGSYGQNLDKIGKKGMGKVSGGLNYVSNAYGSHGTNSLRDPFTWSLSGNVAFSILDFSLPFTFSISNQGGTYTQPFNITAIHPTYKKWKAHIGITGMTFSPYTLTGINFTGGGLEYTPGSWKLQAFGGRFIKAVDYDPALDNLQSVSYGRYGGGFSAGYEKGSYGATLMVLKAVDNINSIRTLSDSSETRPMNNLVVSLKGKAAFFKYLVLDAEYAYSLLTRNTIFEEAADRTAFSGKVAGLVNGNSTTIGYNAVNSSISYKLNNFSIGTKYERIDPGYLTLGGLYFNNDLENFTVTPSFSLLKGKFNVNANIGVQRNNLDNLSSAEVKRWVGNISLSASIIKGLNVSVNYSNFSSFSKRNPAADPFYTTIADTLNYYQVSSSSSLSLTYGFGKEKGLKHALLFNGVTSVSQNITGKLQDAAAFGFNVNGTSPAEPVKVVSGMLGHSMTFPKSKIGLGWTMNGNQTSSTGMDMLYIGPGVNLSKNFEKQKVNLSSAVVYNQNYINNVLSGHVMNLRASLGYQPQLWDKKFGKPSVSFSASFVNRFAVSGTTSSRELTLMLNLGYAFN